MALRSLIAAVLMATVGAVYFPVAGHEFVHLDDLITIVDFETGWPINAERLRFGQRVAIFRIGSPDHYKTQGGMASLEGLIATVTG